MDTKEHRLLRQTELWQGQLVLKKKKRQPLETTEGNIEQYDLGQNTGKRLRSKEHVSTCNEERTCGGIESR